MIRSTRHLRTRKVYNGNNMYRVRRTACIFCIMRARVCVCVYFYYIRTITQSIAGYGPPSVCRRRDRTEKHVRVPGHDQHRRFDGSVRYIFFLFNSISTYHWFIDIKIIRLRNIRPHPIPMVIFYYNARTCICICVYRVYRERVIRDVSA